MIKVAVGLSFFRLETIINMINTLIGQKIDQAQKFLQDGKRIPVTEISLGDNVVVQVKSTDKEGYSALQLGVGTRKKATKSLIGHAKKVGLDQAPIKIKEISVENFEGEMPKAGDLIAVDTVFKLGDVVKVTGVSKGKGFAGVVRRYNFRGGPKTHGQSDRHRAPGSIGQSATPGRVYKGKRMAGRMGSDVVSIANLVVVDIDVENKKIFVSGLVPGIKNSFVTITKTGESKAFVPLVSYIEKKSEVDDKPIDATKDIKADDVVVDIQAETKTEQSASSEVAVAEDKREEIKTEEATVEVKEEAKKISETEEKVEENK